MYHMYDICQLANEILSLSKMSCNTFNYFIDSLLLWNQQMTLLE